MRSSSDAIAHLPPFGSSGRDAWTPQCACPPSPDRPIRASRAPERFVYFMLGLVVREADIFEQTVVELRK